MEEAGTVVETLLGEDPPNAKEAWRKMKGWYQAAAQRGPPPARATLERITVERTELYIQVPSPGENILVTVEPALIDDSVPTEDEIAAAVKKLRRNRSGGAITDPRGAHQGVARGGQEGGVEEEKRKEKTEAEEEGEEMWVKVVEMTHNGGEN